MADPFALPPGASLVEDSSIKLPDGASLVSPDTKKEPSMMREVGEGFLDSTVRGIIGTAKSILPKFSTPSELEEIHKRTNDLIDKGQYGEAAKGIVSDAFERIPGGRLLTGLVHSSIDQAQKAHDAWERGDKSGAALHAAAAIPVVGTMAAQGVDTALGQEAKFDKYGNVIQDEVAPNPARATGQALGIGATVVAPKVAGATVDAVRSSGLPEALQAGAEKQYSRVLNATTKANKARSAKVVPGLLDRGVQALTLKGLNEKIGTQIASFGQKIGDAFEGLPDDAAIPLEDIKQKLVQSAKDSFTVKAPHGSAAATAEETTPGPLADTGVEHATELYKRLEAYAVPDEEGNLAIPARTARDLRQYYDRIGKMAGRYDAKTLADHSIAEAHGMAADAIRGVLAEQFPEIADLNREYSFWKDAGQVVSDTLLRRQGQAKPLGVKIARGAGITGGTVWAGLHGGIMGGIVMDAVEGAIQSPAWNTVSAVLRSKLAHALAFDDVPAAAAATHEISKQIEEAPPAEAQPPALPSTAESAVNAGYKKDANGQWKDEAGNVWTGEGTPPDLRPKNTSPVVTAEPPPEKPAAQPAAEVAPAQKLIPQAKSLTPDERQVEQKFSNAVATDQPKALADYRSRFTRPNGTLEINTDNARELSPDYSASNEGRTAYARAVHEPASWVAKKLYEEEVTKPAPKGLENRVVFTAGGTGAGKTTGTSAIPPGEKPPQIIYDTNSNNLESAQAKVETALSNGKEVGIIYVHRLPEDAFESMIDRAHKTGRPVPIENHIETHTGAPSTLVKLAEIYKDNPKVDIKVVDNTHGPGGAKAGTIDMLRDLDYTGLEGRLQDALEARKREGTISSEIYRAVKGGGSDAGANPEEPQLSQPERAGNEGKGPENSKPDQRSGDRAQTEVLIPGENRAIPARYRLRELSDVQASHSGNTFQPNPKYTRTNDRDYTRPENQQKILEGALPNRFKPQLHITDNPDASNGPILVDSQGNALGGNGRTMMLQRVYKYNPFGATAYKKMLASKADQFGIDPGDIGKMKQPVLVREIADADLGDAQNAVTDFNKTGTAALRPSERAIADARRVSTDTLSDVAARLEDAGQEATLNSVLSGKDGPQVLDKLISDGVISPQERAAYQSGKNLTDDGKARISKLLLGRFFRDPVQLDTIPVSLKNKIERMASPLARAEAAGEEWSLTPKIQEAMDLLEETRTRGGTIDDLINQGGLFKKQQYSPEVIKIAKAIQGSTQKSLIAAANEYAQDAAYAAKGDTLFGPKPTPKESLKRILDGDLKGKPAKVEDHEFSSSQVNLPIALNNSFKNATNGISTKDLTGDGRETEPHITLKYGLHDDNPAALKKALVGEGPIKAMIGKVSIFKGEDSDVVKLDIDSPALHRLNAKVSDALPHTDTHPDYTPHMTLAYVKPGEGQKYVGKSIEGLTGKEVSFPAVMFSAKDRSKTHIPLFGRKPKTESANA